MVKSNKAIVDTSDEKSVVPRVKIDLIVRDCIMLSILKPRLSKVNEGLM